MHSICGYKCTSTFIKEFNKVDQKTQKNICASLDKYPKGVKKINYVKFKYYSMSIIGNASARLVLIKLDTNIVLERYFSNHKSYDRYIKNTLK